MVEFLTKKKSLLAKAGLDTILELVLTNKTDPVVLNEPVTCKLSVAPQYEPKSTNGPPQPLPDPGGPGGP